MSSGGGMRSLYADLLSTDKPTSQPPSDTPKAATPTVPASVDLAKKSTQQLSASALRFQPLRRPGQQPIQKPKIKTGLAKLASTANSTTTATTTSTISSATLSSTAAAPVTAVPATRFSAEDWLGDDDEDGFVAMEKRQRGGRKKRKKNRDEPAPTNWDEIYDPSRPTILEQWWRSDARMVVEREWKDRLYAHRMSKRESSELESSEGERVERNNKFAPPPGLNAAPASHPYDASARPYSRSPSPYEPSPPPPVVPDAATGDDAFARRLQLSQSIAPSQLNAHAQPPSISAAPPLAFQPPPPPPPPPPILSEGTSTATHEQVYSSAIISRPPVRHELPPAPPELPTTEAELEAALAIETKGEEETGTTDPDVPRSLRPGQKGFAERMLAKYGWTKGTGLGATGSGIVKPLQVKVEKVKKKPDSEGGGSAVSTNKGKIIGGKRGQNEEEGKFGPMSDVVVLTGMVDGMDVEKEVAGANGGPGLMQEIGEECESKYGRVERVYIDRNTTRPSVPVFVKFTSQLSALRAVNALEGRIFNGNQITARFFNSDKFENGIYQ